MAIVQNIVAKLHESHKLQDRTVFIVDIVESLRFLRISEPPCNNGTAPHGTSTPPCSSKYFYNPRLWPRIRSLSIIQLVLKWKRMELSMRGDQLHGSSPCISRFLVLCKCDCTDSTRSLGEIDLPKIDWLIMNEIARLQKDRCIGIKGTRFCKKLNVQIRITFY